MNGIGSAELIEPGSIVGPVSLPLNVGPVAAPFRLWYFTFGGERWIAALAGSVESGDEPLPLRIESACIFGHVFHSAKCDCGAQLDAALRHIGELGRGLVIYAVDQDARGLGVEAHFQIYVLRQIEGLDTDEVYARLAAPVDARSYGPVATILDRLGAKNIRLLSNNRQRARFLEHHGFRVEVQPLEVPLDEHNMSTLMLEKEDLDYAWSFKTHGDWLEPLQRAVDGRPEARAAILVGPDSAPVARWESEESWHTALGLAAAAGPAAERDRFVYMTDLPRADELAPLAALGARMVVVPFAEIPEWLRDEEQRTRVRVQDWGRKNRYVHPRPQWELVARAGEVHWYVRGGKARAVVVSAEPEASSTLKRLEETYAAARALTGAGPQARARAEPAGGPPWLEVELLDPPEAAALRGAGMSLASTGCRSGGVLLLGGPKVKGGGRARAFAASREDGEQRRAGPGALYVDSADCAPVEAAAFRALNPYRFDLGSSIPVPGSSKRSASVEAIWQGLKLIDGATDEPMFNRKPYRRTPSGPYASTVFRYGDRTIDLVTARYLIYLPSYLYLLDRIAGDALIAAIDGALSAGREVVFYDWDASFDIEDPSRSFSHSAILAAWFEQELEERFIVPALRRAGARNDATTAERLDRCLARYRRRLLAR